MVPIQIVELRDGKGRVLHLPCFLDELDRRAGIGGLERIDPCKRDQRNQVRDADPDPASRRAAERALIALGPGPERAVAPVDPRVED